MKTRSKFIFNLLVSLALLTTNFLSVTSVHAAGILYVKPSGSGNCSSWAQACKLQTALTNSVSGDEIWVAAGTHKPTTGTDRTISFVLKNGVLIYGGFSGSETDSSLRNPKTKITILSGNIGASGKGDNSYHVVTGNNVDGSAILDGFTISGGYAQGGVPYGYGGGLYNSNGSPTITNVIFSDNYADMGGGMYNGNGSRPRIFNVKFINNTSPYGGGVYNGNSSPSFENIVFKDNSAGGGGGGMANISSNSSISNVTFDSNTASDGGGIYNVSSNSNITNSTFYNNRASRQVGTQDIGAGGGIFNRDGNTIITNVTISHNYAGVGPGIFNWSGSNLGVRNSIIWENSSPQLNQIANTATVTYSVVQRGYAGTGNSYFDPLLGQLTNNGGFSQTIPILSNSSAINAAYDAFCPSKDQRGLGRPKGLHCDIGAFEYTGVVDSVPPKVVSITRVGPSPTNLSTVSFTVTFSKPVDGVDVNDFILTNTETVDAVIGSVSGVETTYVITVNINSGRGTVRLDVNDDDTILDYALSPLGGRGSGNGSFTKGEIYTIEKNSVVSILRINSNPTNSSTVGFIVTFSGNETGVDAGDFVLTNGGLISSTSISDVSGSGNTYTVLVNTGVDDGTIRLDVVDDDSIMDDSLQPLGGIDPSNGDFTSGETYTIKRIASLSAPLLRSPKSKAQLNNDLPTFQWTSIIGAQTYEIQFADIADTNFDIPNGNSATGIGGNSFTVLSAFGEGAYIWRVRAYNNNDQPGKWSAFQTFTIKTTIPVAPNLISPLGTTTRGIPTFRWAASPSAVLYEFVYDDASDCLSPIYSKTTRGVSIRPPAIPAGSYFWCVRAKDAAGNWSGFSVPSTFTIAP